MVGIVKPIVGAAPKDGAECTLLRLIPCLEIQNKKMEKGLNIHQGPVPYPNQSTVAYKFVLFAHGISGVT